MKKLFLLLAIVASTNTVAANSFTDALASSVIQAVVIQHAIDRAEKRGVDVYVNTHPSHNHRRNHSVYHGYRSQCVGMQSHYTHRDYIVVTTRDSCTGRILWEKRIPR